MTLLRTRRGFDGLLALAGLAAAWLMTWRFAQLGDYPTDAGPPITSVLHGSLHGFFAHQPAMGPLSLYLRLPFAALGLLAHDPAVGTYRWGALACVASVALLGVWLAAIAGSRGTGRWGQLAIVLVCVLNPLVQSAVALGHPEELLTATLAVAALVAAMQQRGGLAAVLLGLALASKQWAVLAVLPVLLALDGRRLWVLWRAGALAILLTLPLVVGSPAEFVHAQLYVGSSFNGASSLSWLYPLAPSVTERLLIDGHVTHVNLTGLPPALARLLHSLICAVGVGLAAALWRRRGRPPVWSQLLAVTALIFLLRCTLDTETMPYYHAPLFLVLVAWDALAGERLPVRGLAAAAIAYLVFDRLWAPADGSLTTYAYGACALVSAVALAGAALGRRARRRRVSGLAPAGA
jgi:hypothetical protein